MQQYGSGGRAPVLMVRRDLGVVVPISFLLGRTDSAAIGISGIIAYHHGFSFNALVSARGSGPDLSPWGAFNKFAMHQTVEAVRDSDVFRLSVEFGNGASTNTVESITEQRSQPTLDRPLLMTERGSGGNGWWEMTCLVIPLPPAGVLRFVAEWKEVGVRFEQSTDATAILEAARRSENLWGDGG